MLAGIGREMPPLDMQVAPLVQGALKKKKTAHGGGWVLFLGVAGSEKHTFVFFAPWPP